MRHRQIGGQGRRRSKGAQLRPVPDWLVAAQERRVWPTPAHLISRPPPVDPSSISFTLLSGALVGLASAQDATKGNCVTVCGVSGERGSGSWAAVRMCAVALSLRLLTARLSNLCKLCCGAPNEPVPLWDAFHLPAFPPSRTTSARRLHGRLRSRRVCISLPRARLERRLHTPLHRRVPADQAGVRVGQPNTAGVGAAVKVATATAVAAPVAVAGGGGSSSRGAVGGTGPAMTGGVSPPRPLRASSTGHHGCLPGAEGSGAAAAAVRCSNCGGQHRRVRGRSRL